jgi:O-glycosyl hydrolase
VAAPASLASFLLTAPGVVNQFITNGDKTALFAEQPGKPAFAPGANADPTITFDPGASFQTMDGFGFALTQGSAEVISGLPGSAQAELLSDLFHPTLGIGVSVVRISIGASDLSSSTYTYQEFRSYSGSTAPVGSYVTLQGALNGKYVSSEAGTAPMNCNRAAPSSWETFLVLDAGGGYVALQAQSNGKYVTGSSPMYVSGASIGSAQKFAWLSPTPGQVQLKSAASKKFVCSENGMAAMNCNRDVASGWETFNVRVATFSLEGPDLTYTVPLLKKILAINPAVKVLATPWTAPTWMKSNLGWTGGSLQPAYGDSYATYFKQYLDAMAAQGIHIWAITPQNEPENPYNTPSMTMGAAEQASFIQNYLGPRLRGAGYDTKIICFDHNCDDTTYPTQVCRDASAYVDGSAFHLYAGPISALSTVHSSTAKNVYFTEQWTASSGSFGGDLAWHTENVTIGAANNWARAVIEWNLATDASFGPHTSGGCTQCQGALTVSGGAYARNVSYYIVAHLAKFVRPGALRVGTSSTSSNLVSVGFVNDRTAGGARALVVLNKGATVQSFNISYGGKIVSVRLNAGAVATYVWY